MYDKSIHVNGYNSKVGSIFSSEIRSSRCSNLQFVLALPKVRFLGFDEHHKYEHYAPYLLAKKLGEVESPEKFVSPPDERDTYPNDDLLRIPLGCKYFNNAQFPNERSLLNWIEAIDFGLKQRYITSYGLSLAIFSFAQLVDAARYGGPIRHLSFVGPDRLTTWFQYALEENDDPLLSVGRCIRAVGILAKHTTFRKWNLDSLYGYLNYSLSIYIPDRLKYLKSLNEDAKFREFPPDVLKQIINIEVDLDQPCSLEPETIDEVENPFLVCKQLLLVLLVLSKANVDRNFLRNDVEFAKYLAEKIKPWFIENLRSKGLRFITRSESITWKRFIDESLQASESPFFTREELEEIISQSES
uniref:Uncharacterized protein n=1 Tax=Romanomermis culicivorax TaxID=13658 RepID=A0A915I8M7_ROMCU